MSEGRVSTSHAGGGGGAASEEREVRPKRRAARTEGAGRAESRPDPDASPVKIEVLPEGEGVAISVGELSLVIRKANARSKTATIEINGQRIDGLNAKAAQDLVDNAKDLQKAAKSGKLGKVFGWIAAVATIVVAVLTVNPALGVAALGGLAMLVASETGAMEKLAEKLGPEGMIAFLVVVALVMIAAPSALGSFSSTASVAATGGWRAVRVGTEAVGYGSQAVSSGAQIESGKRRHDGAKSMARSHQREAMSEDLKATIDDALDELQRIFRISDEMMAVVSNIVYATFETNSGLIRNI